MTKPLLLLLLLPVPALAAAIDASAAALQTAETVYTVGLVGGAVLGIYAALGAFRYVREVIGVASLFDTSRDLAPPVRGYVDQASYLDALAQRLAAEDAAAGIEFRDVETGKTNIDYMRESGFSGEVIDRSQHNDWELSAYDLGAEAAAMRAERDEIFVSSVDQSGGLMEFEDSPEPASSSPAVDYGSAFDDLRQSEAEVSAWARSEAEKAGADMALYDKFIAEDDVTFDEALRWSSMGGQVKMPAEPGTSSSWDSQGNYVAPLKSWEQR